MSAEFETAVSYYKLLHRIDDKILIDNIRHTTSTTAKSNQPVVPNKIEAPSVSVGVALTSSGPAPYTGDILDSPDIVWSDDVWTAEREAAALTKITQQGDNVSDYWRKKYEAKAGTYWHAFYQRNADNFYKDRHYLHVVFPELINNWRSQSTIGYNNTSKQSSSSDIATIDCDFQPLYLLEVGCGVGNAVIPLLEVNPNIHIHAFDFAKSAIDILSQHAAVLNSNGRLVPKVCDLVNDTLPVEDSSMDLVLCMFVLSALGPDYQLGALQKLSKVLKQGGKLLFRDYARFDEAQLRFKKGSKLGDNFYVRQDGTCAYFFTEERLTSLCEQAGLQCEECIVIQRQYANRQQKAARYRVWIQAKFIKL